MYNDTLKPYRHGTATVWKRTLYIKPTNSKKKKNSMWCWNLLTIKRWYYIIRLVAYFIKKNQYYRQSFQIIIEYRSTSRLLQVDYMFIVTIETNTGTAACSTINKETKILRIFFFRSYIQKSNFINSYRFKQKKNVSIYKIFFIAIRTCTFVKS